MDSSGADVIPASPATAAAAADTNDDAQQQQRLTRRGFGSRLAAKVIRARRKSEAESSDQQQINSPNDLPNSVSTEETSTLRDKNDANPTVNQSSTEAESRSTGAKEDQPVTSDSTSEIQNQSSSQNALNQTASKKSGIFKRFRALLSKSTSGHIGKNDSGSETRAVANNEATNSNTDVATAYDDAQPNPTSGANSEETATTDAESKDVQRSAATSAARSDTVDNVQELDTGRKGPSVSTSSAVISHKSSSEKQELASSEDADQMNKNETNQTSTDGDGHSAGKRSNSDDDTATATNKQEL